MKFLQEELYKEMYESKAFKKGWDGKYQDTVFDSVYTAGFNDALWKLQATDALRALEKLQDPRFNDAISMLRGSLGLLVVTK